MPIIFALFLALIVATVIYFLNKILPFSICPVCAGVSMAWCLISLAVWLDWLLFSQYQLAIVILMGGTAVGIASQAEKKFPRLADNIFLFKIPIICGGFLLAYWSAKQITLGSLLSEAVILTAAAYVFFVRKNKVNDFKMNKAVEKIKEKMKECC